MRCPGLESIRFFALGALLFACQPKIGDACTTSTDCSQTGDRLCDITEPGGYCTIFNCEPGGCPDDSVCVAFDAQLSTATACVEGNGLSRFARTFCMAACKHDSDCRGAYHCEDLNQTMTARNLLSVDPDKSSKVCIVPATSEPADQPLAGSGGVPASNVCGDVPVAGSGGNAGGVGGQ